MSPAQTRAQAAATSQQVTLPTIPELYESNFLDLLLPIQRSVSQNESRIIEAVTAPPGNPMIDALRHTTNRTNTANGAPAYGSTLSPTLDAFHGLSSTSSGEKIHLYLERAWAEDPELTLRVIWNFRSIHDGKSDKELFYRAWGWLYENHPRTAISNLHRLVEPVCSRPKRDQLLPHGYWKDLLNILALATLDQLILVSGPAKFLHTERGRWSGHRSRREKEQRANDDEVEPKATLKDIKISNALRSHELIEAKLKQPKFRALYIAVARLFAERLLVDIRTLQDIEALPAGVDRRHLYRQLSLAGKWAPSAGATHDRHMNISTAIAMLLHHFKDTGMNFPSAFGAVPEPLNTHILRSYYQRWVTTPLRAALLVTERDMSANRWGDIRYNRVSSACMHNNAEHFYKHDQERFEKYLEDVEKGKKKISGATLLPHVLVSEAISCRALSRDGSDETRGQSGSSAKKFVADMKSRVIEEQWKSLISRLRESGSLDNALAVCDVSGSMGSVHYTQRRPGAPQPILPAIALSLVLAQLAKPPFNNGFITFSRFPAYVQLDPSLNLAETIISVAEANWQMNTDLEAVFLDLLLPLAVKNKVRQEDMIKRLFIFSDMQFDSAVESPYARADWATTHDIIEKAYRAAGYEMPQIVYWDLRVHGYPNMTAPVTADKEGVALMNGFSPALLKVFMGEEAEPEEAWERVTVRDDGEAMDVDSVRVADEFTPVAVMRKTLQKKSFDGLVVLD